MKNVLILGAGQSTPYLINYMLKESEKHNWFVTVCDRDYELAASRIGENQNGVAIEFDVNDERMRKAQISKADVVINMLAPTFQYLIALDCLNYGKHMITASYENINIPDLHKDALRKNILILNEMGLDPGIDHMSAISLIHQIKDNGGKIRSFISYGSGLPAPEVEANPLHYCITWNPRNVVMAGESGAQYMENGKMKILPHHSLFQRTWSVEVEGIGMLEAYPNRDSLIYIDLFKIPEVETMIRGTLRYPGWSETWLQLVRLGFPNEGMRMPHLSAMTYQQLTETFLPLNDSGNRIKQRVANFLGINPTGSIMSKLEWLGIFSDQKIKGNPKTPAEVLRDLLIEKMPLPAGARDMVALVHEIEADYPDENKKIRKTSTLIEFGEPNGFTAISKTVGLPAAIAAKLLLTDQLPITGCQIPTHPVIYNPVLKELENLGLKFTEKEEAV